MRGMLPAASVSAAPALSLKNSLLEYDFFKIFSNTASIILLFKGSLLSVRTLCPLHFIIIHIGRVLKSGMIQTTILFPERWLDNPRKGGSWMNRSESLIYNPIAALKSLISWSDSGPLRCEVLSQGIEVFFGWAGLPGVRDALNADGPDLHPYRRGGNGRAKRERCRLARTCRRSRKGSPVKE